MPWLHRLRQPTLVLAGDDDPIVPMVNGRLLAWRIPQARLHVVRGGGHLFLLERPADVAALVADFLDADFLDAETLDAETLDAETPDPETPDPPETPGETGAPGARR
jgi:predicted alpha/beta-fold hydrolase